MLKKIKLLSFNIENILIIFLILVSKTLYFETFGENKLLVILLALVLLFVLFKSFRNNFFISIKAVLFYLLLIIIIFINPNAAISTSLVFTISITISLLFTSFIPLHRFTLVFYNFVKFLMIASLFRYFFIFANISSFLPDFYSIIGDPYKNFLFFGIHNSQKVFLDILRNNGLWWEPGAFQVIINLAFILGLVFKKISRKDFFLFLIVILTTLSTAGIVVFSLLSFIYLRRNLNFKLIALCCFLIIPILFLSSFYETVIESKLSLEHGSSNSRFNDAALALRMFSAHPYIGTGMGNLQILEVFKSKYAYGTGSNGILSLLANLGMLSFIIFIPLFCPGYLINLEKKTDKIIVSLSLFLLFSVQNFTIIPIFATMIFYGIKKYRLINFINSDNEKG